MSDTARSATLPREIEIPEIASSQKTDPGTQMFGQDEAVGLLDAQRFQADRPPGSEISQYRLQLTTTKRNLVDALLACAVALGSVGVVVGLGSGARSETPPLPAFGLRAAVPVDGDAIGASWLALSLRQARLAREARDAKNLSDTEPAHTIKSAASFRPSTVETLLPSTTAQNGAKAVKTGKHLGTSASKPRTAAPTAPRSRATTSVGVRQPDASIRPRVASGPRVPSRPKLRVITLPTFQEDPEVGSGRARAIVPTRPIATPSSPVRPTPSSPVGPEVPESPVAAPIPPVVPEPVQDTPISSRPPEFPSPPVASEPPLTWPEPIGSKPPATEPKTQAPKNQEPKPPKLDPPKDPKAEEPKAPKEPKGKEPKAPKEPKSRESGASEPSGPRRRFSK